VPDLLKTVIFRITQEAMNNAAKHSRANLLSLSLNGEGKNIELAITDNGMGFNVEETLAKESQGDDLTSLFPSVAWPGL
jgi:two-component system NarL family sensor kinase